MGKRENTERRHTRFTELAGEINTAMPEHVVNRVIAALNFRRKALNGSRILVIDLVYKPNGETPLLACLLRPEKYAKHRRS
jgi:UDP-N-acetyl-D-mannosaminuronate dehydrogenase